MADVPDGEVPRDAAFLRTVGAIAREDLSASARLTCAEGGHLLLLSSDWSGCERCGATDKEILPAMGYVRSGDSWVLRAPAGSTS